MEENRESTFWVETILAIHFPVHCPLYAKHLFGMRCTLTHSLIDTRSLIQQQIQEKPEYTAYFYMMR